MVWWLSPCQFPHILFPCGSRLGLVLVFSHSVVCDSLRPHGLQPARLLCPSDFSGKNTGAGCHFLLYQVRVSHSRDPSGIWHQKASFSRLQAVLQGRCHWTPCTLSQICCWQGAARGPTALSAPIRLLLLPRISGQGHLQLCGTGCWLISQVVQIIGTGGSGWLGELPVFPHRLVLVALLHVHLLFLTADAPAQHQTARQQASMIV